MTRAISRACACALALLLCACGPDDGPKRTDGGPNGPVDCFDGEPAAVSLAAAKRVDAWLSAGAAYDAWPEYPTNPFEIPLPDCFPNTALDERGAVIVHDLDGDGLLDFIVSGSEPDAAGGRTGLVAFDWSGRGLFAIDAELKTEPEGDVELERLPNDWAPAFAVGDVDRDDRPEIVHLDRRNQVQVRSGTTGALEYTLGPFDRPSGASDWGQLQIVNLRGLGDTDLVLQANPQPLRWLLAVRAEDGSTLWRRDDYRGPKHGGFRAYDLDLDGRDEVAGATLIDDDGTRMNAWDYREIDGHLDSVQAADVRPDVPGLEVVMTEESYADDRTALLGVGEAFWYASRDGEEPQNVAVGDFDTDRPGLEIWNRSRFEVGQRPWVFDANGELIAEWVMNDVKPPGWSEKGIETIYSIDWSGSALEYLAAKERHTEGRVAVIDALSGEFVRVFDDHAKRIYVVDVAGDSREEIVVLDAADGVLRIHWNDDENPYAPKPRKWLDPAYRRAKQNYNYYSP